MLPVIRSIFYFSYYQIKLKVAIQLLFSTSSIIAPLNIFLEAGGGWKTGTFSLSKNYSSGRKCKLQSIIGSDYFDSLLFY